MCKIMPIIGINRVAPRILAKFQRVAATQLTSRADDDGFGYAGLNEHGLHGERWLDVDLAMRLRFNPDKDRSLIAELGGTIIPRAEYSRFGRFSPSLPEASSLLLHARASTNTISLDNTHPFVINSTALIHNGMVSAQGVKNEISSCDSELILQLYLKHAVATTPANMQSLFDGLSGYWACAVLAWDGTRWIVDVFKDSRAFLYYAVIPELGGAKVYCTSDDMLRKICRAMEFHTPRIFDVKADFHARFDAITGEVICTQLLKSTAISSASLTSYADYCVTSETGEMPGRWEGPPVASTCETVSDELSESEQDEYNRDVVEAIERSMGRSERKAYGRWEDYRSRGRR